MPRILCVGIATLDVVNRVSHYPDEDAEVRALGQQRRLGGNAANTASVLAQLGLPTAWVGHLGDGNESHWVRQKLESFGVDCSLAQVVANGQQPTSYVTLSQATGSRTIVHYRDLPEYPAEAFLNLDLRGFDWVHFEGRAIDQLQPMLQRARGMCGIPISLEVEKPRPGIEGLFEEADLLMFSRDYVQSRGFTDPEVWLAQLPPACMATCTWGESGAWARDFEGRIIHQPAYLPSQVVDTLGAGDVFNAAMIAGVCGGLRIDQALPEATQLAGVQCGREGLELKDV